MVAHPLFPVVGIVEVAMELDPHRVVLTPLP